jgi:hypothetical protein
MNIDNNEYSFQESFNKTQEFEKKGQSMIKR